MPELRRMGARVSETRREAGMYLPWVQAQGCGVVRPGLRERSAGGDCGRRTRGSLRTKENQLLEGVVQIPLLGEAFCAS